MITISKGVFCMLAAVVGASIGLCICHQIHLMEVETKLAKLDGVDTGLISLLAAVSSEENKLDKRITVLESK